MVQPSYPIPRSSRAISLPLLPKGKLIVTALRALHTAYWMLRLCPSTGPDLTNDTLACNYLSRSIPCFVELLQLLLEAGEAGWMCCVRTSTDTDWECFTGRRLGFRYSIWCQQNKCADGVQKLICAACVVIFDEFSRPIKGR